MQERSQMASFKSRIREATAATRISEMFIIEVFLF